MAASIDLRSAVAQRDFVALCAARGAPPAAPQGQKRYASAWGFGGRDDKKAEEDETEADVVASTAAEAEVGAADTAAAVDSPTYTVVDVDGGDYALHSGAGGVESGPGAPVAWFKRRHVRGSVKKLSPIARAIRGLTVHEALAQLAFSSKGRAKDFRHCVSRAAANAEAHLDVPPERLVVQEAFVGKNEQYPALRFHAKGRGSRSLMRYSQITIKVRAMDEHEAARLTKTFNMPEGPPPARVY